MISGPVLLFTAIAVLIRTPVYLLSILRSNVDTRGRLLIAWFGPRGLSSLLLILLPVFAGVPGSDRLFAICSLVVLVSIVLHGGSPMLLARAARKRAREAADFDKEPKQEPGKDFGDEPLIEDAAVLKSSVTSTDHGSRTSDKVTGTDVEPEGPLSTTNIGTQRISIHELRQLWQASEPVTILDVRTERSLEGSDEQAKGALRMPPDNVAQRAKELGLKQDGWLVAYCA